MLGLNQLLPLHSTQIISKNKGLSVSLPSITKSPSFVLQACSPRSCASLTPSPSLPDTHPPAAHVELPKGFGAPIVYIVNASVEKNPRQEPIPLSPATPCSHARLPAPWWSCLPASISPLLIPLEAG